MYLFDSTPPTIYKLLTLFLNTYQITIESPWGGEWGKNSRFL